MEDLLMTSDLGDFKMGLDNFMVKMCEFVRL